MFVVEELRLNTFRNVSIPSNKDIFSRVGSRPVQNMQDGQTASFSSNTMDALDDLEAQVLKDSQMPLDANV